MMKKKINDRLYLDLNRNEIVDSKSELKKKLEPRLIQLLVILLEAKGKVVDRSSLIHSIWGNYNSGEQLLTHSMSMLRKEIGHDTVITVPKKGYLIEFSQPEDGYQSRRISAWFWWGLLVIGLTILKIALASHH